MDNRRSPQADRRLMDALRDMARRLDPVPAAVAADAVAALAERTVDKDLATLVSDSLLDGTPAPDGSRRLTFVGRSLCVQLDVGEDRLRGQLFPAAPADLELRRPGSRAAGVADEQGRFSMPAVPAGALSLHCRRRSRVAQAPVVTDWVTL